ncbi:ROK family protein [Actinoplanes sp. OR16]|uniref:ROK family protein n=1 Tax=Actinoplanes sp. OR16 TaxID=946334 RepID=UPI001E3A2476|nr:ROK family protein [Actinoplanes sp. OR16]
MLTTLDRLRRGARAEIALETGLARSAITNLSAVLLENRLVRPVADQPPQRVGRRIEQLEIDGRHLCLIGAQLEVDQAVVVAHDLTGRELHRDEIPVRTPRDADPETVAKTIADGVAASLDRLTGVSPLSLDLVVPGGIARDAATVSCALDLGWIDVPYRTLVAARLPAFPAGVHLAGDGSLAAYAEFAALRAEPGMAGLSDVFFLKSATGVGAGVISEGQILRSALHAPGHMIVVPDGEQCECGRRGCFVTVADPEVVVRRAGLTDVRRERGLPMALDELVRRVRDGDPAARAAAEEAVFWFRILIDNANLMYEPQMVVLGGYLAAFAAELADLPETTLSTLGYGSRQGRDALVPARLGAFAAVQGALTLRRLELLSAPARSGLLSA